MGQFFVWTLAIFLFINTAHASCTMDDVKEAEDNLRAVTHLYRVGHRTHSDVEYGKQQVQDVKFCAGMITRENYCRSRQSIVQNAVAEKTNGRGIHKKVWLLEANARFSSLCSQNANNVHQAILRTPSSLANTRCTDRDIDKARAHLSAVNGSFSRGFSTVYDIHFAEDAVLETRRCAQDLDERSFCSTKAEYHKKRLARISDRPFHAKIKELEDISQTYLRCQSNSVNMATMQVCDRDIVKDAQDYLAEVQRQRAAGNATNRTLSEAHRALAHARYCASPTQTAQYCESYIPRTQLPAGTDFDSDDTVAQEFLMNNMLCRSIQESPVKVVGTQESSTYF